MAKHTSTKSARPPSQHRHLAASLTIPDPVFLLFPRVASGGCLRRSQGVSAQVAAQPVTSAAVRPLLLALLQCCTHEGGASLWEPGLVARAIFNMRPVYVMLAGAETSITGPNDIEADGMIDSMETNLSQQPPTY